ncbi:MAG: response regulator transcription factor [Candidatus Sulfotelmatobacter sp.]
MYPGAAVQKEISSGKIRCVLVHDYVLWRQGLRRLLEDEADLEVVSEAGDAVECLREVFKFRPDVVIADANAFGVPASDAELLVARQSSHTKLVFLSEQELLGSSLDGQALMDYSAPRQTSVEQLVKMVRKVCHGTVNDSELYSSYDVRRGVGSTSPQESSLTAREREVLKLLAEGKTVRATASALGLSSKTVDAHKFNLMRKLGIHNKAELVMWAIQKRVVKIPA